VNSKADGDGLTPLVRACKAGEQQVVVTLIDKKANVDLKDGSGTQRQGLSVCPGS
jgi:hypothetical protein